MYKTKKIILCFALCVLIFSLCACGDKSSDNAAIYGEPSPVWKIMNFLRLLIRTLLRLFYLSLHRCMMMDWEIRRRLIVKYIIW